jgi:hypothetical protein
MGFLLLSEGLRNETQKMPIFWNWLLWLETFMSTKFRTQGDVTLSTKEKGVVMTNAAGTITKRIRLNDIGTGFIIEDV